MENEALIYRSSIAVRADVSEVWQALIDPAMTQQYMFGCIPITDWRVGNPLIWRGAADGVDYVVGTVLQFDPHKVLSFTTFDPNSGYPNTPENHLAGTYTLTWRMGETVLDIEQGDFSKVQDGQKRYDDAAKAWPMTLSTLKALLEA